MILLEVFLLSIINSYIALWIWRAIGSPTPEAFNRGMIFSKYGEWVVSKYIETQMYMDMQPQNKSQINWYKAFGACLFCFASWLGIFLMIVENLLFDGISIYFRIFAVWVSATITSTNAVILNNK